MNGPVVARVRVGEPVSVGKNAGLLHKILSSRLPPTIYNAYSMSIQCHKYDFYTTRSYRICLSLPRNVFLRTIH